MCPKDLNDQDTVVFNSVSSTIIRWTATSWILRGLALACIVSIAPILLAQTSTVAFDLDDVWLLPDITRPWESAQQMTGSFEWAYEQGDFENGSGQFLELYTPWYNPGIDELNITVESASIEFSLRGNYHDLGLDLSLFVLEPLSANQPAAIDTDRSQFEIQQGSIWQGHIISGSAVPIPPPLHGDVTLDGAINASDIDLVRDQIMAGSSDPIYDLNADSVVNDGDMTYLVETILGTVFGDADLNLSVDAEDLSRIRTNFGATHGWAGGNFDLNLILDANDLSAVRQNFGFSTSPATVPEPGAMLLLAIGLLALWRPFNR